MVAPEKVDRTLVDNVHPSEGFGPWTEWKCIMTPHRRGDFNTRRKDVGFREKVMFKELKEKEKNEKWYNRWYKKNVPGIYELRVVSPNGERKEVVYIGKAKNLRKRLSQYCYDGSHISKQISNALRYGCEIECHWIMTKGVEEAAGEERYILTGCKEQKSKREGKNQKIGTATGYLYHWNKQHQGPGKKQTEPFDGYKGMKKPSSPTSCFTRRKNDRNEQGVSEPN